MFKCLAMCAVVFGLLIADSMYGLPTEGRSTGIILGLGVGVVMILGLSPKQAKNVA